MSKSTIKGFSVWLDKLLQNEDLEAEALKISERVNAGTATQSADMMDLSILLDLLGDHQTAREIQMHSISKNQYDAYYSESLITSLKGDLEWLPIFYCDKDQRFRREFKLLNIMAPGGLFDNTQISHLTKNIPNYFLYTNSEGHFKYNGFPISGVFVAIQPTETNIPILERLQQKLSKTEINIWNRPESLLKLQKSTLASILNNIGILSVFNPTKCIFSAATTNVYSMMCIAGDPMIFRVYDVRVDENGIILEQNEHEAAVEQKLLSEFRSTVLVKYAEVFERLQQELALDYYTINFCVDTNQQLIILDINTTTLPHKSYDAAHKHLNPYVERIAMAVSGMIMFQKN